MMNTMLRTFGVVSLSLMLGISVGCGGGPIWTGGLGPFAPDKFPPVDITLEDLPDAVRKQVDTESAAEGVSVVHVTKDVRDSDGRYYYAAYYTNPSGDEWDRHYWHDGSPYKRSR